MPIHHLSHITDLHRLSDDELHQFMKELPGMVAGLRIAHRAAEEEGLKLSEVFPIVAFDSDTKLNQVVFAHNERVVGASVEHMVAADRLDAASSQDATSMIARARAAANPGEVPKPSRSRL